MGPTSSERAQSGALGSACKGALSRICPQSACSARIAIGPHQQAGYQTANRRADLLILHSPIWTRPASSTSLKGPSSEALGWPLARGLGEQQR